MLFNSYVFICLFLPLTLGGFYLLGAFGRRRAVIGWLVAASLVFYGWWNPVYLFLILGSVLFNYGIGLAIGRTRPRRHPGWLLSLGIAGNLALLAYFKYTDFFIVNVSAAAGLDWAPLQIVLPLAISFFTFQQIAFLVDTCRGEAREYDLLRYFLFVTFFPQLIAGPIVHHKEMMPQFAGSRLGRFCSESLAVGVTIFAIGLFKKVILADTVALYATPVFDAAEAGRTVGFFAAWQGVLAYTGQIYFDFSGYCDMAIGLARMFGIRLPLNFDSPYKAASIIDFWRRWHMTLSRFLRDYLYIPLGGGRRGAGRRHLNLMIVMLLGGLWHGAGWTFVIWGGLHGLYLLINHLWRGLRRSRAQTANALGPLDRILAQGLTLLAVVVAWTFFRAKSLDGAMAMLAGMSGQNGFETSLLLADFLRLLVPQWLPPEDPMALASARGLMWSLCLLLLALIAPNTQQFMRAYGPTLEQPRRSGPALSARLLWRPRRAYAALAAVAALVSLTNLSRVSEFLYFQF